MPQTRVPKKVLRTVTLKPASLRAFFASFADSPPTPGTAIISGPFETVKVIVPPFSTLPPTFGSEEITLPASIVLLKASSARCTISPAFW